MRNLILALLALCLVVGLSVWFLQAQQQEAIRQTVKSMKMPRKVVRNIDPLLKRAGEGDMQAQYELGQLYLEGKDVKQDIKEASKWMKKAAKQGHVKGAYEMGRRYELGIGVRQNYMTASSWYKLAASYGNDPQAQFALGELFFKGKGVPHSYGEAREWYEKAANKGHPIAQFLLGAMYQEGWAVEKDLIEAYKWYSLSMSQEERVQKASKQYKPTRARDAVAAKLNKQQIKEAEELVQNWQPAR